MSTRSSGPIRSSAACAGLVFLFAATLIGCSPERRDEPDTTPSAKCGDGSLARSEVCDPGIVAGLGVCPTACADELACTKDTLEGTAAACTARCAHTAITACVSGDGCCAQGCTSANDSDCGAATCGNGRQDAGETCDGDCPTTCPAANGCARSVLVGSASACTAACVAGAPITTCTRGDGCCPAQCSSANDNDCGSEPFCGNNVVDQGETCDGNCPTSCSGGSACAPLVLSGSASACTARCTPSPITQCGANDGCCPSGCTSGNDNDCACAPRSCLQQGIACGPADDGCGRALECGGCFNGNVCNGSGQCVPPATDGGCVSDAECGTSAFPSFCNTEAYSGNPGGVCSAALCLPMLGIDCPAGLECAGTSCVEACTGNGDCRTGYRCDSSTTPSSCEAYGSGSSAVGTACSTVTSCAGGFDARCRTALAGYPGGYCTRSCSTNACPSASHCASDGTGENDRFNELCVANCTGDGQCRAGYVCAQRDSVNGSECLPGGTGSGGVGSACTSVQNCAGRERALCLQNWPGGTCTLDCASGGCPNGSTCTTLGSSNLCLKTCTGDGHCRQNEGYRCISGTCQK